MKFLPLDEISAAIERHVSRLSHLSAGGNFMSLANRETVKSRPGRPSEQVILFSVGNHSFAIAAEAVQEIRSTDSLSGTAAEIENSEIEKVAHTLKHARHSFYVVNARIHFGLPASRPTLVMILRGMRVAVLVDRIERMAEVSSMHQLPRAFVGQERKWYRGIGIHGRPRDSSCSRGWIPGRRGNPISRFHCGRSATGRIGRSGSRMSAAANSFVLLHIGERRFAFPASLVTELAPAVRLHRFPHTTSQLLGVIMRRGKIVPVYDPRSVFGAKRSSANLFYLARRM